MNRPLVVLAVAALLIAGRGAGAVVATPPVDDLPDRTTLSAPGGSGPAAPSPAEPPPAPPAAGGEERPPRGNPLWGIPLNQLRATRERPLFVPSRRPAPSVVPNAFAILAKPAAPPAPPPAPEKPPLALVGTVAAEAGAIGMFVDPADKTVLRLKLGDSHKGWVLREVKRGDVVVQKESRREVLALPPPSMKAEPSPAVTGALPSAVAPPGALGPGGPAAVTSPAHAAGGPAGRPGASLFVVPPAPNGAAAPVRPRPR